MSTEPSDPAAAAPAEASAPPADEKLSKREERPRLRPLEGYPITHEGQQLLALRDPSGIAPTSYLHPIAAAVLQLCDGHHTRDQIVTEFVRRYGRPITRPELDEVLAKLDEKLVLDSDKFRNHSVRLFAEFGRAEVRPPLHAGVSYPKVAAELRALLDKCFDPPHGPGRLSTKEANEGVLPRAIITPHIDFRRGGPAYAWAYKPLLAAKEVPELIVVLGTDHAGADHPFTLTKKHYDTPLGRLTTDGALVDHLREKASLDVFVDEHHHRGEHSIEFQAVWLRYVYGERMDAIPTLPVLCGSLHRFIEEGGDPAEADAAGGFLRHLTAAVAGRRVLWIAAADLAHVGPRYGDAKPLDAVDRASLEKRDQVTLGHVARGDARGWFEEIKKERDQRRVCGLTPIWALLDAAKPPRGQLAAYAQCPAEEGSVVSIASFVY